MITPSCPQCGGPMRVKVARRGPNPGSEFWGCNAFRARGCRGTHDAPRQEWDWFGLVRIPVSIIRNAQNSHYRDVEESLDYRSDAYGVFGGYSDYDGDMAYFEQAMDAENRRWAKVEANEIDQILSGESSGHSLARRIISLVNRQGMFGQARDAIAYAITENFAGSARGKFVSLAHDYPGETEIGVVYLDDGSELGFNRTTSGILLFVTEAGLESAIIRDGDFKHVAKYFAQNFGSHAPSSISYM